MLMPAQDTPEQANSDKWVSVGLYFIKYKYLKLTYFPLKVDVLF